MAFEHLDPSAMKVYKSTVLYSFETIDYCIWLKVRGGYVVETPKILDIRWIRGQHVETLAEFFVKIMPLRIVVQ